MNHDFIGKKYIEPIEGETVVQQIIKQMINAIQRGNFKIGERLPSEFELMKELHVSRNSLREAIKIMTAMGILEIRRGDGTYLCSQAKPTMFDSVIYGMLLESSTNKEIVELRQMMDEIVLKLGIEKCDDRDIETLQDYIYRMRESFAKGDYSQAARLDYDFHIYLVECSKNPFLIRIVKGVYMLFEQSIEQNIRTEELFANADEHHQDIVDCLKSRDTAKIESTVARSLSSWRRNVDK